MATATRYIRSTPFPQQNPVCRRRFGEKHSLVALLLVSLLITLLPPASVSANAMSVPQHQETTGVQGEIAYVLNGNIWLHDLVSGNARQLTSDGDNLEPNWSPDGRYLIYSHGVDLESADLYMLDVVGEGDAQLLVERACCGAWSPDGEQIAYVDLSGEEPALRTVRPDGTDEETLLNPLTYGRGAYPMGKLEWVSEKDMYVPLEIIAEDSLSIYRDVIVVNLWTANNDGTFAEDFEDGCAVVLNTDAVTVPESADGDLMALAVAFEPAGEFCSDVVAAKGIYVNWFNNNDGRFLPWLAAPTLSADGVFLAAERYLESAILTEADLWGVVVVNTLTGDEVAVAEDASQPAWRPAPPLDSAALRFIEPGERLVTLEPPLRYNGELYRISYLTTGDLQRRDAGFFHLASPSFFADQEILGLVVTNDGIAVTDPDLLRHIFERYHAAYHLYVEPPPDLLPLLGEELDTVLGNPLLMAMSPAQFLTSARNQNAAALRAMLSIWNGEDEALSILDDVVADTNQDAGTALEALGAIIEDQYQTNKALTSLHADLKVAYESSQETVAWSGTGLKLLRLAGELLVLAEHQQERAGWLQTYVSTFPSGVGGLNRDQLRATATVLTEAEDVYQQRLNLVVDFAKLEGTKALVQGGMQLTQQAAADLIAQLAAKYGTSLSSQAVAGLLSTVSVGLTVNSMLYGADDLVANFQLARRSEDLRTTFRAAVADVQNQADLAAGANIDAYDGDLAEHYRVALLLDTLAAISAYHAYADGVAASQRIPNLLTLINSLRGEDWQAAAEGLHQSADNGERTVLNDLANSAMLDAAVTLALTRMNITQSERVIDAITGMSFVHIPAGKFIMGSTAKQETSAHAMSAAEGIRFDISRFASEKPQHTVYLDDYWIGQTEVTNAQFQHFIDAGGYKTEQYWSSEGWQVLSTERWSTPRCWDRGEFNAPEQPVVCISWYEAEAYTHWLSEVSGMTIRLPTEAEWEKAARGTDGRTFPWGEDFMLFNFCDANCPYDWKASRYDDGYAYTAPVGSYPDGASPYGALDMAGNVWEWVNDWYQADYYSDSPGSNPQGPTTGDYRVLRGGSWDLYYHVVRSANRNNSLPVNWDSNLGFRLAFVSVPDSLNEVTPSPVRSMSKTTDEILIPAGTFQMGCDAGNSVEVCGAYEQPLHTVNLDAYYIDKYEVTNGSYKACVDADTCTAPQGDGGSFNSPIYTNHPVVNITWDQANVFCIWAGKRLPTEAEWEKAARGSSDTRKYPWGDISPSITLLNFANNVGNTTEVSTYPDGASPYGVLNMAGNVWEWVNDKFGIYYDISPDSNPQGPDVGDFRVLRGGSWNVSADYVRLANRTGSHPDSVNSDIGFRCAHSFLGASTDSSSTIDKFEPSRTVITAQEYYDMTRDGSDYQTTQYQEAIIGSQVSESGTVQTIKASGEVTVYMDVRYGQVFMHLDDIAPDLLLQLNTGDKISFSGTISYFGYSPVSANAAMHLNNVVVTDVE